MSGRGERPARLEVGEGLCAREIPDPLPGSTLGGIGRFVEVSGGGEGGAGQAFISIPYSEEDLGWVDPATLRVFEVDVRGREYRLVPESGAVPHAGSVYAWISGPGTYAVIGVPRHPGVLAAVRELGRNHLRVLRERRAGSRAFLDKTCGLILCAGPGPWAPAEGRFGVRSGPGQGICERCLGLDIPWRGLPEFGLLEPGWTLPRRKIPSFPWPPKPDPPIVFASNLGTHPRQEVYVIRADGSGLTRLTHVPAADDIDPHWSPDGRQIAFVSDRDGHGFEVWVMDADGTSQRNLDPRTAWGADFSPDWSPDGTRLVYASGQSVGYRIWRMDATGANRTALTQSTPGGPVGDIEPAWASNGRIYFASDRTGDFEVWAMDGTGANQQRLTNGAGERSRNPKPSPDGTRVVFTRTDGGLNDDVWIMDADGSSQSRLTSRAATDFHPAWSPNGKEIVFSSNHPAGGFEIWIMGADAGNQRRLTSDGHAHVHPDWSLI